MSGPNAANGRNLEGENAPAFKLAQELVLIASNVEYGDLRRDMVESLLMRSLYGDLTQPNAYRLGMLAKTLQLVLIALEGIADEVRTLPGAMPYGWDSNDAGDFVLLAFDPETDQPAEIVVLDTTGTVSHSFGKNMAIVTAHRLMELAADLPDQPRTVIRNTRVDDDLRNLDG